ncbi:Protein of unknown function [Palleronia marisminoris]|uniref:Flagellar protein n=1 Tax=Palleronia marisminoris TaxID=315423 RepID=A0A1Y5T333_9RHOB|nr:DUF1217 domain-containing protein [Palleronia marisminoris]SFH15310.1 Protein of unknown function [Palleronia marisminoris]SLN54783.1 hypothetical protein PAM7066_02598 [Palleronia marisminoris]
MSFAPIVVGSGLAGWSILTRTRETQQAAFDRSPVIAGDVAAFKEKISSIETSDQLLDDRRLLRVALGAFGLDSDINNRAFIKKVLDSDPADERSFANRLSDKRYLSLAQTFGFTGTEGPQVSGSAVSGDLKERLKDVATPDDLLSDPVLLRLTLKTFGLESDEKNTYFLRSVLESDPADPTSFANRLSDPKYLKMTTALDFANRGAVEVGLSGFVAEFEAAAGTLGTVDDLLKNERLLNATLDVFGLDRSNDIFLRDVLTSDLTDETSFVNQLPDKRYKALSGAFNFGGPAVTGETRAETFVAAVADKLKTITEPRQVISDLAVRDATEDFFGLDEAFAPYGVDILGRRALLDRILTSDPTDPKSFVGLSPDKRYYAASRAFGFNIPERTERAYPDGFADQITRRYADRQFEIGVGNSDQSMRIALSLERELTSIAESGSSAAAQWYTVMSSPPLRQAFETVFNFPSSFAALDVDQQLSRFMERSEATFGTSKVSDFVNSDKLDELTRRFLMFSAIGTAQSGFTPASAALSILSRGAS